MNTSCVRRQLSGLRVVSGCFAGLMLIAGCNSAPPPVDTKAVEDAVRAADVAWSKAAGAMDVAATNSYYADDAVVMPPNMPVVTTHDGTQKAWASMLVPGNSLAWTPSTVTAAGSGDMAFVQGTYTASMKGPDGKTMPDTGKYLEVWKKQADGSWKAVDDIWNSDMPVAAPAPVAKKKKG
jgi:ketosteroid isomerase-like protein